MAQKMIVTTLCDLPHEEETEAPESIHFAFDGVAYDLDACKYHAAQFTDQIAPYAEAARVATGGSLRSGAQRRHRVRTKDAGNARAWAAENGFAVSTRGRIPAHIEEAYRNSLRRPAPAARPVPVTAPPAPVAAVAAPSSRRGRKPAAAAETPVKPTRARGTRGGKAAATATG